MAETTYKKVRVDKQQHGIGGGRYFIYITRVSNGSGLSTLIQDTSLDRCKDSINRELAQGAVVVDGVLIKA